jgi:hypothetical protein
MLYGIHNKKVEEKRKKTIAAAPMLDSFIPHENPMEVDSSHPECLSS